MSHDEFNLAAAARQEMIEHGFQPDFPAEAERQLAAIHPQPDHSLRDLTALDWSSIDNDDSRDLDQIEWAERAAGKHMHEFTPLAVLSRAVPVAAE